MLERNELRMTVAREREDNRAKVPLFACAMLCPNLVLIYLKGSISCGSITRAAHATDTCANAC